MGVFVVDSNFFIEGLQRNFPADIFASYWARISTLAHEGKIISLDKVQAEIYHNEDLVSDWCAQNLPPNFFKDSSNAIAQYASVIQWAHSKSHHYRPAAVSEFADSDRADAWIIAFCLADTRSYNLVTHETREPERKSKIKIPDVCDSMGITCNSPIEMMRGLGEKF